MPDLSHAEKVRAHIANLLSRDDAGAMAADGGFLTGGGPTGEASMSELRRAQEGLLALHAEGAIDPRSTMALEAIVLPRLRPVVDIRGDSFAIDDPLWAHLAQGGAATHLRNAIPAIGRVEFPWPQRGYGGTGFVVGPGLMMTNRHVAELFAQGLGLRNLDFRPGRGAAANMRRELGADEADENALTLRVPRIRMIHPWWDMALIEVEGLDPKLEPLKLSLEEPADFLNREIAVIGYPGFDDRNDADLQMRIFRRRFQVKRLQPGKMTGRASITDSFGNQVNPVTHDASTLGGNSGSAVICTETGRVLGLHFAGLYLKANYAVPARELARDRLVREVGVAFDGGTADPTTAWDPAWALAQSEAAVPTPLPVALPATVGTATVTLPVSITLVIGPPTAPAAPAAAAAVTERAVAPPIDPDYPLRRGYNPDFLGINVPLPTIADESVTPTWTDGVRRAFLPYHNLSIAIHATRRLALCTAANVDGSARAKRPEPFRDYGRAALGGRRENDTERWVDDPRIAATYQLPDVFYNRDRKAFDKGHLARREDMAFGDTYDALRHSNNDTYHSTNCSPQVAAFNRQGPWRALEEAILTQGKAERYAIFAGPAFRDDDPEFEGRDLEGATRVRIPLRYWKVLVCVEDGDLAAYGFALRQDLSQIEFTAAEFDVSRQLAEQMWPLARLQEHLHPLVLPEIVVTNDRYASTRAQDSRASAGRSEAPDLGFWD